MGRIPEKMIGFKYKSASLRTFTAMLASVLVAACGHPFFESVRPQPAVAPEPAVPESIVEQAMQLPSAPEPDPQQLSAELLYDVLLGEIAGQRGVLDVSGARYLEAARQSDDPRIAERALKITVFGKQQDLALHQRYRSPGAPPREKHPRETMSKSFL